MLEAHESTKMLLNVNVRDIGGIIQTIQLVNGLKGHLI